MYWKERLLEIAREVGAFQEGDFTFSSGKISHYYFDGRKLTLHPEGLSLIAEWVFSLLTPLDVASVGGPTLGADATVGAVVLRSHQMQKPMIGFLVRPRAKRHGMKNIVEGILPPNSRVALFDDTITTGASLFSAIKAVEEQGCEVVIILTLADWQKGGSAKLREEGYRFETLFRLDEFHGISIVE